MWPFKKRWVPTVGETVVMDKGDNVRTVVKVSAIADNGKLIGLKEKKTGQIFFYPISRFKKLDETEKLVG